MKFLILSSLLLLGACHQKTKTEYVENPFDNSRNNERLNNLEQRVSALESQAALTISQMALNSVSISSLQSQLSSEVIALQDDIATINAKIVVANDDVEANEKELGDLKAELAETKSQLSSAIAQGGSVYVAITNSINALSQSTTALQNSVNTTVSQLTQLQMNQQVVKMIDPCPAVPSNDYKEMFFKLSSGTLIAYFEDGGKRFLTVLKPGYYRTTDSRGCIFSVDSNNVIHN